MLTAAKQQQDAAIEARIHGLQTAIELWARSRELWYDCGFRPYLERTGGEPRDPPVVTVLAFDGPLYQVFNGTFDDGAEDEFSVLISQMGFEYELEDHSSLYIYPTDPAEIAAFAAYFHWQWICGLVQPDFADVYDEVYGHFAHQPEDLHRLGWRDFEVLLAGVFRRQGFEVELGPGSGDGGVDLRLLQRDPLGDMLTLVQAKKYAPNRKIKLEAVQALHGAWAVEKATNSMFVTTSEYLPSARKFAARTDGALDLRTSQDVQEWCAQANAGVIEDKSKLVSRAWVTTLLTEAAGGGLTRVLHAHSGYNTTANRFALLLKETKHAALLMALPRSIVSHDGHFQMGFEAPAFGNEAFEMLQQDTVWRARRKAEDGRVTYWDGRNLYCEWSGAAEHFNYYD